MICGTCRRGHPPKGANFDSRFVSREGAKNAKERACDGFFVPSLEEVSSATEFRSLRVLRVRNAFAVWGEFLCAKTSPLTPSPCDFACVWPVPRSMRRAKSRRRGAVDHRMRLRSQAIEVCVDESPRLLMTFAPNCGYTHVPRIRCIWLDWLSSCPELLATHLE